MSKYGIGQLTYNVLTKKYEVRLHGQPRVSTVIGTDFPPGLLGGPVLCEKLGRGLGEPPDVIVLDVEDVVYLDLYKNPDDTDFDDDDDFDIEDEDDKPTVHCQMCGSYVHDRDSVHGTYGEGSYCIPCSKKLPASIEWM